MESKEHLESTAPTVEEAIILGVARLGTTREQVDIEVLDAGSRGFLGLGARDARVRLTLRAPAPLPPAPAAPPPLPSTPVALPPARPAPAAPAAATALPSAPPAAGPVVPTPASSAVVSPAPGATPRPPAPAQPAGRPPLAAPRTKPAAEEGRRKKQSRPARPVEPPLSPATSAPAGSGLDTDRIERVALEVAQQLFGNLRVHFTLTWRQEERPTLWLSLRGSDAEELVGPGARTLDDLQYLVRLLVHRLAEGNYNLVLDADGYRERRQSNLETLARQAAERAIRSGRPVRLRSMPASERRLIHLTLQTDPRVRTESSGSGRNRAVTIIPQSKERG